MYDPTDHTRRVAAGPIQVDGVKRLLLPASISSWWDSSFQFEWPRIENYQPSRQTFILAGDFNNPAGQGYERPIQFAKLQDSFIGSQRNKGDFYTVGPGIDG